MKKDKIIKELELLADSCDSNYALEVNGYTQGVNDAIDLVKKMSAMSCCKSDSELLAGKEKQKNMIIKMMRKDEESGMYSDNES